jgi:site-specific recombinase XerD
MRKKLNDLVLRHLTPPDDKPFAYVWDEHLPAFGVRVGKNRKTFVAKRGNDYLTLGHVGVVTLADARQKAKTLLYAKYLPKVSPNAQSLVEEYQKAIQSQLRPKSVTVYGTYLRRVPNKALSDLTPQDWYAALPEKKTAANMCWKVFKSFCSWCLERGHLDHHPLANRKQPNKTAPRNRLLTRDEVLAIWRESFNHGDFGVLTRLLVATGQRLTQFTHLETAWIKDDRIVFSKDIMKNHQEHSLPLTEFARKLIPSSTAKYIWGERPFSHPQNHITLLRAALPDIPHWSLHDARRFLSSSMSKMTPRVDLDITEAILAHVSGSRSQIQRTYDIDDRFPQMRDALNRFNQLLLDIGCTSV